MNPRIALLVMLLVPSLAAKAQEVMATMQEGAIRLIRGTSVLQGVEGMRVRQGDILESSSSAFLQIEFPGGTVAALGPSSRMLVLRAGAGGGDLVLLSGWLKSEIKGSPFRYQMPLLGATSKDGALVLHAAPGMAEVFVESGSGSVAELSPQGSWGHTATAKTGQFFSRNTGKTVVSSGRPSSTFLDGMPRMFRDTLPSRLTRFAGKRPAEPRRDHDVTYPDIQAWLTTDQLWRRGFVERFQPRLKDPEFRQAVEQHLREHPEWDPILHPEKYQTNPPSTPADSPKAPHGRN